MDERAKAAFERYEAAMHAMQSGVAQEMNFNSKPTAPKYLRVGVNSALVNDHAMTALLMEKGIITELEYAEALATAAEHEKARYEERLAQHYGMKITLA